MEPVRIGVIGCGRIAQAAHLPALAKADGVQLLGVADPSPSLSKAVGGRYAVGSYGNTEDLLAQEGLEAVVVAVPDRLHLPLALQALAAGKHVLVEKPLAGTVADARELATQAAESGLVLQVGAMKRHDPGVEHAARAVRTQIGEVLSISAWYRVMSGLRAATEATLFPPMVIDQQVRSAEAAYKADREGYLLTTHGAHVFDGLRYLAGDVHSVRAQLARTGPDYSWHVTARLGSGALASVEITANAHAEWSEGVDVYGTLGAVRLRSHFPFELRASEVEVFTESTATSTRAVFGDSNPYERQAEAFACAVRGVGPVTPTAQDGVAAVELIEAVAASAAGDGALVHLAVARAAAAATAPLSRA